MIEKRRPRLTQRPCNQRMLLLLLPLLLPRRHPTHPMYLSQMHRQTAHACARPRAVLVGTAERLGLGVGTDMHAQTVLLAEGLGAAGTLELQGLAVGLEVADEFGLGGEGLGTPGAAEGGIHIIGERPDL